MTVRVYKSTDTSAPVLTGLAGSLCTVLDAVLVNGYGALTAAGWAIAFTGTNKRIYRAPNGALRPFLRVQDDAPRASPFNDGREARLKGSEGASAIDTQTLPFPVTPANGIIMRKSLTADSTPRPWIIVADNRTLYMFVLSGDYGAGWASFCFGEYYSVKSTTDSFNGIIIGSQIEQIAATPVPDPANENLHRLSAISAVTVGHWLPRPFTQVGAAVNAGKHGNGAHSSTVLAGLYPYPNPVDGSLYLNPLWVHEDVGSWGIIRGRMRGLWQPLHPVIFIKDQDTFSGAGPLAGKTFLALNSPDLLGTFIIETSDTWEEN